MSDRDPREKGAHGIGRKQWPIEILKMGRVDSTKWN